MVQSRLSCPVSRPKTGSSRDTRSTYPPILQHLQTVIHGEKPWVPHIPGSLETKAGSVRDANIFLVICLKPCGLGPPSLSCAEGWGGRMACVSLPGWQWALLPSCPSGLQTACCCRARSPGIPRSGDTQRTLKSPVQVFSVPTGGTAPPECSPSLPSSLASPTRRDPHSR